MNMNQHFKTHVRPYPLMLGVVIGIGIGLLIASMSRAVAQPAVRAEVHSLRIDAVGHEPLVPLRGYHFVIVDTTIRNDSDATVDVAPLLNFYIKDSQGFAYTETGVPTKTEMRSGALPAHDSLREEIGFMVKDGADGLRLYYEPGTKGSVPQVIDLTPYTP